MPDVQLHPGGSPQPGKPVVLIPVPAEDVVRRQRRKTVLLVAVAVAAIGLGWYVYRRTVNPVDSKQAYADGMNLFRANRYEQATLNFSRAIDLNADFADAYRMRGRAYAAIGKPYSAVPDFTKVASLQPKEAGVLVERGFAYLDEKDLIHAMADSTGALALNNKLARAYNLRATVERSMGEGARAIEDFSHAVELDPNLDNYFQRAATYQALGDHQRALADYDQALAISPSAPHTYFARAQSKAALGDSKGAQEDIQVGRKIDGW
jgi:tetratricopeptide (TPR) repeat protein